MKHFAKARNVAYFTYLDYFKSMLYTTNWIDRLNRSYKRTLRMRTSMPSASSVCFLIGSVAMSMTEGTYGRTIDAFKKWEWRTEFNNRYFFYQG